MAGSHSKRRCVALVRTEPAWLGAAFPSGRTGLRCASDAR
jgi:hypothetical protein